VQVKVGKEKLSTITRKYSSSKKINVKIYDEK
jgi:hypothetical protein